MGTDKKEFLIHSALLASQSDAFEVMVNGRFAEAISGKAILADVEEDTFVTFAKFAYQGDYDLPLPVTDDMVRKRKPVTIDGQHSWSPPTNQYWKAFISDPKYVGIVGEPTISPLNARMDDDFSNVFISQAKIAIFADCYGIKELTRLSMHKLHHALSSFRLSGPRVLDIVALARFCYDSPAPKSLRKLVICYLACIVESISHIDSFTELLKENVEFAADLVPFLVSRIRLNGAH